MTVVVPTVLASTPDEYTTMFERAASVSQRVHIDVSDGQFTDAATISLAQVHISEKIQADLHLMLENPVDQLETALALHPNLIIFHVESQGNIAAAMTHCRELGTKAGVALLPKTSVESAAKLITQADHV